MYASKQLDIVWLRLKLERREVYFCFFYAPGAHLSEDIRLKFYQIFAVNFDKYVAKGNVILRGESNARLDKFLNDFNVHGKPISNKNKPLFLGFLEYSELTLLNKKYSLGVPTYQIVNKNGQLLILQ